MPTIKYADYITGDDETLDGTNPATPYKTITVASIGLTGGDEVRVAKSPAASNLTGTLEFTLNSTAVVGTDTLFTSELVIGDFILGGDGNWWEVIVITDNTHATLYKKYSGATEDEVSSQKLGITSTGAAAGSTTYIQEVSASGVSAASMLKISGGWDLTGPTQDGQTYFRQMHGTFNSRYGYALYATGKSFVEIERLHFLRYYAGIYLASSSNNNTITASTCNSNGSYGIYIYASSNNIITAQICNSNNTYGIYLNSGSNNTLISPTCNSNGTYGIVISNSFNNTLTSPTCNNNNYGIYMSSGLNSTITTPTCNNNNYGIYLSNSPNNTITTPICNSNDTYGIYLTASSNNTLTSPTCNSNGSYGIYLRASFNNTITAPTCNSNDYGIYIETSSNNIVNKFSGTENITADIYILPEKHFGDFPCAKCQQFQLTTGDNRCFYEYGETYRDTVAARSTQCLKYDPNSETYYISQNFFFKAGSGVAQTLSAYIKKEAAFNGDVQGAIFFMGVKITGWTDITPTANDTYEQKSLVAAAGDITEDGVLELRIKVRGSAGNVFVDDLATA